MKYATLFFCAFFKLCGITLESVSKRQGCNFGFVTTRADSVQSNACGDIFCFGTLVLEQRTLVEAGISSAGFCNGLG